MGLRGPQAGTTGRLDKAGYSYRKSFPVFTVHDLAKAQQLSDRIAGVLTVLESAEEYPSRDIDGRLKDALMSRLEDTQGLIIAGIARYNGRKSGN